MDEPSKVIRERIHFSLPRAVISPEIFRFSFDKSNAKITRPFLLIVKFACFFCFKFSSSTFVIFLSHGWPLQWQPWCLVLRHSSEMRINKDGSGYKTWCQRLSSKRKNICGREFPQTPRHDNSCLPKDQIIPLSHSGAFPWSASSSPAKWSSEGRSILWRWRRGGVWLWWRSGSYGFRFWRKRFRTRMDTEWNSTASVQVCLVTRGKLICLFRSCDLAYRSTVGLELLNYG